MSSPRVSKVTLPKPDLLLDLGPSFLHRQRWRRCHPTGPTAQPCERQGSKARCIIFWLRAERDAKLETFMSLSLFFCSLISVILPAISSPLSIPPSQSSTRSVPHLVNAPINCMTPAAADAAPGFWTTSGLKPHAHFKRHAKVGGSPIKRTPSKVSQAGMDRAQLT